MLAGYDVGSLVAQQIARSRPDLVRALVLAPPVPGFAQRLSEPRSQPERWYVWFHQLELATRLVDGRRDAVRTYLEHFWSHWSGPKFQLADAELERLTDRYAAPGAFRASIALYRAGRPPSNEPSLVTPTTILWPEHDPLFPFEWSEGVGTFFSDVTLEKLAGSGHFSPLEAPEPFAAAIALRARAVS